MDFVHGQPVLGQPGHGDLDVGGHCGQLLPPAVTGRRCGRPSCSSILVMSSLATPCPGHRGGSWLVPGSRLRGCLWSSCPPGYDRTRRAWAIQGSVLANPACLPPWVRVLSSPPSPGGSPGCPLSLTGKGWGNGALGWPIKASARKCQGEPFGERPLSDWWNPRCRWVSFPCFYRNREIESTWQLRGMF